jgi:hypothetical protein
MILVLSHITNAIFGFRVVNEERACTCRYCRHPLEEQVAFWNGRTLSPKAVVSPSESRTLMTSGFIDTARALVFSCEQID